MSVFKTSGEFVTSFGQFSNPIAIVIEFYMCVIMNQLVKFTSCTCSLHAFCLYIHKVTIVIPIQVVNVKVLRSLVILIFANRNFVLNETIDVDT